MDKIQKQIDYFYSAGMYQEAYQYMINTMQEAINMNDDDIVLGLINELMGYYRVHGDFEMGQTMVNNALAILEKTNKQASIMAATTYLNIATLYKVMSNYNLAKEYFERCKLIYQNELSKNDERYISLLNNISIFYFEIGLHETAIKYASDALSRIQECQGSEIETAISYTNIAQMYNAINDIKKGESCLKKAIELFEMYGKNDPHYFSAIASLGQLAYLKGEYQSALSFYQEALDKIEHTFGKNTDYQIVLNNYEFVKSKVPTQIKGLVLSKEYYNKVARDLFYTKYRDAMKYATIGLIGPGSECYGYDDEISTDHDFGPGFCVWLPDNIYEQYGKQMQNEYDNLPKSYLGFTREDSIRSNKRVGIFSITEFYNMYTPCIPKTNREWFYQNEQMLSMLTSGEIFESNDDEFLLIRKKLQKYPRDVKIKKMIKSIAIMAQAGQYNYPRINKRNDIVAKTLALNEFITHTMNFVFLANEKYKPFYKWSYRAMQDMQVLKTVQDDILELCVNQDSLLHIEIIERICMKVKMYLKEVDLSDVEDNFLDAHIEALYSCIVDKDIANMQIMEG